MDVNKLVTFKSVYMVDNSSIYHESFTLDKSLGRRWIYLI